MLKMRMLLLFQFNKSYVGCWPTKFIDDFILPANTWLPLLPRNGTVVIVELQFPSPGTDAIFSNIAVVERAELTATVLLGRVPGSCWNYNSKQGQSTWIIVRDGATVCYKFSSSTLIEFKTCQTALWYLWTLLTYSN